MLVAGPAPARLPARGPAYRGRSGCAASSSSPRSGRSPTSGGRSSSCSPTSSAPRCRRSRSTTRPTGDATEATVLGPFFDEGRPGDPDRRRHRRRRLGPAAAGSRAPSATPPAAPVPGARLDVWEADGDGSLRHAVRRRPRHHAAATCAPTTRAGTRSGHRPRRSIPSRTTAPSATCSRAAGRTPMRASHLHFLVTAAGYRTLVTHIFVSGRRTCSTGHRLRGQGLADQGLHPATRRYPDPGRPLVGGVGRAPASTSSWRPRNHHDRLSHRARRGPTSSENRCPPAGSVWARAADLLAAGHPVVLTCSKRSALVYPAAQITTRKWPT